MPRLRVLSGRDEIDRGTLHAIYRASRFIPESEIHAKFFTE